MSYASGYYSLKKCNVLYLENENLGCRSFAVDNDLGTRIFEGGTHIFFIFRNGRIGPVVEKTCLLSFHVDTAVRHGVTKVFMPVGAMNRETAGGSNLVVAEKHNIRDIGEIVIGVECF